MSSRSIRIDAAWTVEKPSPESSGRRGFLVHRPLANDIAAPSKRFEIPAGSDEPARLEQVALVVSVDSLKLFEKSARTEVRIEQPEDSDSQPDQVPNHMLTREFPRLRRLASYPFDSRQHAGYVPGSQRPRGYLSSHYSSLVSGSDPARKNDSRSTADIKQVFFNLSAALPHFVARARLAAQESKTADLLPAVASRENAHFAGRVE